MPNTHESAAFGVGMAVSGVLLGLFDAYRYASTNAAIAANEPRAMPVWAAAAGGLLVTIIGVIVASAVFQVR